MADAWATISTGIGGPARNAAAVTPNDSTDLSDVARSLWVGGSGDLSVDMQGGQTAVAITGVVAGTILPLVVTRVRSTGTTATGIVALW